LYDAAAVESVGCIKAGMWSGSPAFRTPAGIEAKPSFFGARRHFIRKKSLKKGLNFRQGHGILNVVVSKCDKKSCVKRQ